VRRITEAWTTLAAFFSGQKRSGIAGEGGSMTSVDSRVKTVEEDADHLRYRVSASSTLRSGTFRAFAIQRP